MIHNKEKCPDSTKKPILVFIFFPLVKLNNKKGTGALSFTLKGYVAD